MTHRRTKPKPIPLDGSKPPGVGKTPCTFGVDDPKPPTRLTYEELQKLSLIVEIDLKLLENVNRDGHTLDDMIQERKALLVKLEKMRLEIITHRVQ